MTLASKEEQKPIADETTSEEDDGRGRERDKETLTMDRITRLLFEHEPAARADIMEYLYRRYCRRNGEHGV